MSTLTLPAVRKLPLYRWLMAGVAVLGLLVGASYIKTTHKTVLQPVTSIVQALPEPPKAAPAPVNAPKKRPVKHAPKKS